LVGVTGLSFTEVFTFFDDGSLTGGLPICRSRFSFETAGMILFLFFIPAVWQGQTNHPSNFSKSCVMAVEKIHLAIAVAGAMVLSAMPVETYAQLLAGTSGSGEGMVYAYQGGTNWTAISPSLGGAVLDIIEFKGTLYAATMSYSLGGEVWRYDGGTSWAVVGDNMDNEVCALEIYNGQLYAGTAEEGGNLYRYNGTNFVYVGTVANFSGIRAMHSSSYGYLQLGEIDSDMFGRYDGNNFYYDTNFAKSCIVNFAEYNNKLYAAGEEPADLFGSTNGINWSLVLSYNSAYALWGMEPFQGQLYLGYSDGKLAYIDSSEAWHSVLTVSDSIISMVAGGNTMLYFGTGAGAVGVATGSGPGYVYAYTGNGATDATLISGPLGTGVQCLYYPPDPLLITPVAGFDASVYVGGPFSITNETFSLTNTGTNSLDWSLTNTSSWLDASPGGGTLTAGGTTNVTVSLNSNAYSLTSGIYTATVWFTDLNDGVVQSRQFTLTVIGPPVITCPSNITVTTTNSGGAVVNYTVTVSGGCPPITTNCVPPSGSVFPIGATTVNCSATDSCGQSNSCSFTVTVSPPLPLSITCPSNITVTTTNPDGAVVNYTVTVSGGCPPITTNCAPPSGSVFPIGTTTVNCSATDSCGQSNSCSFTVTVSPLLSITCRGNITVTTTNPDGAVVNYTVTVSGGCPPITTNCAPPSGSVFPIGTTTVNCSATDSCGQSASCSFTVGVDALLITPETGFTAASGCVGRPFSITNATFSLTNIGIAPLNWSLANTSLWLDASPSGGELTPGGGADTVTVSLNSNAYSLTQGNYSATVWFTNLSDGVGQSRQFSLTIGLPIITAEPTNQTVMAGGTATFSVTVSATCPSTYNTNQFTYQWQLNGTNLLNGIITTVAGNGINGYSGDYGRATNASLSLSADADPFAPSGVALDASGNLFIADVDNGCIRKVDNNGIITTVAGGGHYGLGDGGAATSASLIGPSGVAVDASGNLFIADRWNYRIREVDPDGIITTVAGNGSYGYSGDGGQATSASLAGPSGVAVDASGNLFIADTYNNVIRKVDNNGIITTVAGNGINGYSGDGGQATSASLVQPSGVAVDASGDLFIADTWNNRIREVNPDGIITTVAGNGSFNYSGDGGQATSASLAGPSGVAVDASGNLFIADMGNFRIREVLLFASQSTLTLCNVTTNNAGNYTVIITNFYGSVTSSVASLMVRAEDLQITPATGFTASGYVGGPFSITNESFSLTNTGTNSLNWTLVNTSVWLNASPGGGTLMVGGTTNVTVSLNSNNYSLTSEIYTATVWFTNLNDNVGQSWQFILVVTVVPNIAIQKATPGMRIFAKSTVSYTRDEVGTFNPYVSWYGGPFPASYSFTLANMPPLSAAMQEQIFLIPVNSLPYAPYNNPFADYDATNCFGLLINATASNYSATVTYKVNAPNAALPIAVNNLVTNYGSSTSTGSATGNGTWTLTFTSDTTGWVTGPGLSPVNFNIPAGVSAQFANPLVACFGIQPNSAIGVGQYVDFLNITITNGYGFVLNDNFASGMGNWTVLGGDAGGVWDVTPDSAYWLNWINSAGYDVEVNSDLTAANNWINPAFYDGNPTGYPGMGYDNGLLTETWEGTKIWTLISTNDWPGGATRTFFRLSNSPIY
jgi:sugar lactone lactonase YvrE